MSDAVLQKLSEAWHLVEEAVTEEEMNDEVAARIAVNGQQKLGEAIDLLEQS